MARVFAHLMGTGVEITDQAIFTDTSRIIGVALERTHQENAQATGVTHRLFEIAVRQLVEVVCSKQHAIRAKKGGHADALPVDLTALFLTECEGGNCPTISIFIS